MRSESMRAPGSPANAPGVQEQATGPCADVGRSSASAASTPSTGATTRMPTGATACSVCSSSRFAANRPPPKPEESRARRRSTIASRLALQRQLLEGLVERFLRLPPELPIAPIEGIAVRWLRVDAERCGGDLKFAERGAAPSGDDLESPRVECPEVRIECAVEGRRKEESVALVIGAALLDGNDVRAVEHFGYADARDRA